MSNGHRGGHRMVKHWASIAGAQITFTASSTKTGNSVGGSTAETVLRMIGEYSANFTAGSTIVAGDKAQIGIGIGVFSADAFVAGAASMPEVLDEAEYPWLFWNAFVLTAVEATDVQNTAGVGAVRRQFDIRSMRKLKPREVLGVVAQYIDLAGAPPVDLDVAAIRVLSAT